MYPGQFNLHITDKNALINRPQNALYNQPYILKLRNQPILLDQIQQGKDVLTDSYLSQSSEQKYNQVQTILTLTHERIQVQSSVLNFQVKKLTNNQKNYLSSGNCVKIICCLQLLNQNKMYQQAQNFKILNFETELKQEESNHMNISILLNMTINLTLFLIGRLLENTRSKEFKFHRIVKLIRKIFILTYTCELQKTHILRKQTSTQKTKIQNKHFSLKTYIRWTKNYRQKRNQKIQELKQIRQKYTKCLQTIGNQNVLICKLIIKKWVSQIIDPLIKSFSTNQFIQQSNENSINPNSDSSIQNRQHQFVLLTIQILKNMEKFTEKDKIPELIQTSLFLSLFKSQNNKAPVFVAKRTKFYTKSSVKIGNYQEKLIIGEYFIFRLLLQHLIESSNHMVYQNINHKMLCKFMILSILGILQILFQDYFSELKQYDESSTELFQRRIKISKQQDISIITDDNIDLQQSLIYGLHDRQNFQNIIEKHQEWLQDICTRFSKILQNLHSIL
ncbi:unnamed protein product (macronuclear) [Paramecium tetraurelia]|uniref:Transmembrane protein n=1 Tax=Paramecium tetraurelia TaxID=5888 RepID=A0BV27_PARTE|nr:uncharacterized protein GSPATT00005640001 [Paramecium tetraurelia]CAK62394.1 unnamed protein product [Paramecium tetraurelia]|eukprot:XP_001429792.1 hypothetical protein (macronuclear) [Paramecium tetraurelia strain d4-2]